MRRLFAAGTCALLLGGCGLPSANSGPELGGALRVAAAKHVDLLYANNEFYTFPDGNYVGQFDPPNSMTGLCSDASGNIWALTGRYNDHQLQVVEYAHGGTTPLAQLNGRGYLAMGCAVDRHSHDLAVTTYGGGMYDVAGLVTVFPDAPRGAPIDYHPLKKGHYYFCAYDDSGNLFVDGHEGRRKFVFLELPKGGKKFEQISLVPTPIAPGPVQWGGFHIAVADANSTTIYQYAIEGTSGTLVRTTTLDGAARLSAQYALIDGVLVYGTGAGYGYWNFPAGGNPRRTLPGPSYAGFAISL